MVERAVTDRAGESHLVLKETADAAPGEALVFQFDYRNARPGVANSFVITNPIPDQMVYAGTDTPGEVVSVDGGRSFGPIAEMKVADADGVGRTATPPELPHLRRVIKRPTTPDAHQQPSFPRV